MKPVRFQSIDAEDGEELFELYKRAFFSVIEDSFGWDEEFQRERFESHYELSWFKWIEVNQERVGYICYWKTEPEIHISLLIIKPDKQGRGYGTLVMERIHAEARQAKSKVTLSSFRRNESAIRFYEALNYVIVRSDEHFVDMSLDAP